MFVFVEGVTMLRITKTRCSQLSIDTTDSGTNAAICSEFKVLVGVYQNLLIQAKVRP